MAFFSALRLCLTTQNIIFCVIAGIVVGFIAWMIRDIMRDDSSHSYSLIGHMIVGIIFAYIGLAIAYNRWDATLFSVQAIACGVIAAAAGALIVGSALIKV
ncbi:MAG: hypothetical protein LUF35_11470 [Lachnospiraceae bacterium]|nr:hypothetical protein [Lachnospiraceae bacterium]